MLSIELFPPTSWWEYQEVERNYIVHPFRPKKFSFSFQNHFQGFFSSPGILRWWFPLKQTASAKYQEGILSYIAEMGHDKARQISKKVELAKLPTIIGAFPQNNYCKTYFLILSVNKFSQRYKSRYHDIGERYINLVKNYIIHIFLNNLQFLCLIDL